QVCPDRDLVAQFERLAGQVGELYPGRVLQKGNRLLGELQHPLLEAGFGLRVDRTQRLVPDDQVGYCLAQCGPVERSGKPNRERQVVEARRIGCLLAEPQSLLGIGRGDHDVLRLRGRSAGRAAVSMNANRSTRPATVGASKISLMVTSACMVLRIRLISRVASSEWPPRSKKLSSMVTGVCRPRTLLNSPASASSCGVRGGRPARLTDR